MDYQLGQMTVSDQNWRQKLFILNLSASVYLFVMYLLCGLLSTLLTIPDVYCPDDNAGSLWFHRFFITGCLIEVLANYIAVKSSAKKNSVSDALQRRKGNAVFSGTQDCSVCRHVQPPRCHHCVACGKCILGRDHHCFFMATCIGHWNLRHFIVFLFHATLGTVHSLCFLHYYITHRFYFPDTSSVVYISPGLRPLLLPVVIVDWWRGYTGFFNVCMDVVFLLVLAAAFSCIFFGVNGLGLVFRGQTVFEASIQDSRFQGSILHNFRASFGSFGLLQFVWPLPFIPLPSDGLYSTQKLTV